MSDRFAQVRCPDCQAEWYKVGEMGPEGSGNWGYIKDSGPVDGGSREVECPECHGVFIPGPAPKSKTDVSRFRWFRKNA